MIHSPTSTYFRLIALWVVCEAFIGGLIHGLHIPISGLVVGSAAVTCIALIGWYHPSAGSILRATLVVLIFKMLLSPQAPITAYMAVLFQGLLGEILFRNRKYFSLAAICFAVIALLESAFQRFLIMTFIYGNDVWTAINEIMNKIMGQSHINYSRWFIGGYAALHLLTGLLLGYEIARLPGRIGKWKLDPQINDPAEDTKEVISSRPGKKIGLWIIWILLIILLIQSEYGPGESLLPKSILLHLITRSIIIISGWVLVAGPLMKWLIYHWLKNKQGKLKFEMEAVMLLLPEINNLVMAGVRLASKNNGWKKYSLAIRYILVNALYEEKRGTIYVLSGPKGSGKTSSLIEWARNRKDVSGLLSPVVNDKRMFFDLITKEEFTMEANDGDEKVLKVGKYIFSQEAFDRANEIIKNASAQSGWLIIDEVGPLELRGEGLNEAILYSLKRNGNTILVTREGLEEQVVIFCQAPVKVIHSVEELPE